MAILAFLIRLFLGAGKTLNLGMLMPVNLIAHRSPLGHSNKPLRGRIGGLVRAEDRGREALLRR